MNTCPDLLVDLSESILTLRFNRLGRKNAITLAMYAAAAEVIAEAGRNPGVRVILLADNQGCFTSGNDLMDFMKEPEIHADHPVVRFMQGLQRVEKPVVARVRGPVVGIGATLLLHCDLVYASDDARLQLPFVNLGLCPEYAASWLLPRHLGYQRAAELLLLGEPFTGAQAADMGLINMAVPDAELDALVDQKLARLVAQPPAAMRRAKLLMKQSQQASVDAAIQREYVAFSEGLQSEECKEAVTAFFEKRAPDFSRFY